MTNLSKRLLATIMFTDMVGYTALMQEDEALARKKRKRHREVFDQLHIKYHGQIIQYFGDGTLSIFQNATDATQCAIDLQLQLKEPIEVALRIGLHLGEVVLEEDQLIGDAVNVASRVESFAATGSVLVSKEVIEAIEKICGQHDLDDYEMVDLVMALVAKSLLQTEETEEETRFFMLETIREYALESLEKSRESRSLKLAHIDYFLSFAEEAGPNFNGPEAESWAKNLGYDNANCLAVIDQAIALGEIQLAYRMIQSL